MSQNFYLQYRERPLEAMFWDIIIQFWNIWVIFGHNRYFGAQKYNVTGDIHELPIVCCKTEVCVKKKKYLIV